MTKTCFHLLDFGDCRDVVMNSPFAGRPPMVADEAFAHLKGWMEKDDELWREMQKGKMAGVLCVRTADGETGYIAAFSGQVFGKNHYEGFVPPVSDYLEEDSYYNVMNKEIVRMNKKIAEQEEGEERRIARSEYERVENEWRRRISEKTAENTEAKKRRDELRQRNILDAETEETLKKESATKKSELHKMKKEAQDKIGVAKKNVEAIELRITQMKTERARRSEALQEKVFRDFRFRNGKGEEKDLVEIFGGMPPSGSGECCAPRLLDYALRNNMKPLAIGEYWIGESPRGKVRHNGTFYHACRGKCLPILEFVLQGIIVAEANEDVQTVEEECIRTLYRDESIMVISKPSGMASVKGKETVNSVEEWAEKVLGKEESPHIVHRLDMDTSGVMVLAVTRAAHKELQRQFEAREVKKLYRAVVNGIVATKEGDIDLPLSADIENRPMQMVDMKNGVEAKTHYEVESIENGRTRMKLWPKTGRTHQLRVHLASQEGLGAPIVGDRLYSDKSTAGRLMLHAEQIIFRHPITNKLLTFIDKVPF